MGCLLPTPAFPAAFVLNVPTVLCGSFLSTMTTLDATDSAGLVLRVRFTRERDRYAHAILAVEPSGREHLLLESVEGTADDEWPSSPPLQSLSIEELAPGRRAALLVGMAGRSHWSASIEAIPGRTALVFDIACRLGTGRAIAALGSTYCQRQSPSADFRWSIVSRSTREGGTATVARQYGLVKIQPAPATTSGATIRWQYQVEQDC
jgi:hypothetical protein